jgi:hypothetical protein
MALSEPLFPPEGEDFNEWLYAHPEGFRGNVPERKAFRKWCGERFTAWYVRAYDVAKQGEGDDDVRSLESDFYESGMREYYFRVARQDLVRDLMAALPDVTDEQRRTLELFADVAGPLDDELPLPRKRVRYADRKRPEGNAR